jgi:hypothetical protein
MSIPPPASNTAFALFHVCLVLVYGLGGGGGGGEEEEEEEEKG